jgi:hypothetical protein
MRYNLMVPPESRVIPVKVFEKYYLFAEVVCDILMKLDSEISGAGR